MHFLNNQAGDQGGAVFQDGSNTGVTFMSCTLNNNFVTSGSGGAAYVLGANTAFTGTTFDGNNASVSGGAVYGTNPGATITMQQVCAQDWLKVGLFVATSVDTMCTEVAPKGKLSCSGVSCHD